jgi:hypothetical protein
MAECIQSKRPGFHVRSGKHYPSIIKDDIYAKAAPVPDATPSPDRNEFLKEVLSCVQEAADEMAIAFQ